MTMRGGGTAEDRGPPCGAGRSRLRLGRRGGGKTFFFFSPGGGEVNVGPRPSFGPRGGGREAPWQPGPGALGAGAGPGRLGPGWPGAWREEAGPSWRVLLDSALPLSLSVRATATHRESPSASLPLPVSLCQSPSVPLSCLREGGLRSRTSACDVRTFPNICDPTPGGALPCASSVGRRGSSSGRRREAEWSGRLPRPRWGSPPCPGAGLWSSRGGGGRPRAEPSRARPGPAVAGGRWGR